MNAHRKVADAALRGTLAGGLALALTAYSAAAQGTDPRWLPWLGCWEAVDEVQDESMLCLRPLTDDVGVEMLAVTGGEVVSTETVRADGAMHETDREGCRGFDEAEFSSDGRRVYLRTEHLCEGQVRRETTGMIAMLSPTQWIDVRGVEYSGRSIAGAVRYRLASIDRAEAVGLGDIAAERALAVRTARMSAAIEPDVDDVIDAMGHVDKEVVRTWVAERNDRFELDSDALVRMADAGVPPEVIDVMVAVSYPDRFAVDQDRGVSELEPEVDEDWQGRRGYGGYRGWFWDPFYYSPWSYGFGRYGYGSYGYGYGYGYPYYYRPTVVVVQPKDGGGLVGRVVKGRGYTRSGRGSSADGGPSRTSGGASASPGRSRGDAGSSTGSGSTGGSTSTGRKAKPRGGGGEGGGL